MDSRTLRRKERKNKIVSRIRRCILLMILLVLSYVAYGFYDESKIKSIEESKSNIIKTEKIAEIKEEKPKETVDILDEYLGYSVIAQLEIPKINLKTEILEDYTEEGMKVSPVKFWGPEPNEIGNFCITGHNYLKENMFKRLKELKIGDEIYLYDNKNGKFTYTIYEIYKVKPDNMKPINQETNGRRIITLITCVNYTENRLIVQAMENKFS